MKTDIKQLISETLRDRPYFDVKPGRDSKSALDTFSSNPDQVAKITAWATHSAQGAMNDSVAARHIRDMVSAKKALHLPDDMAPLSMRVGTKNVSGFGKVHHDEASYHADNEHAIGQKNAMYFNLKIHGHESPVFQKAVSFYGPKRTYAHYKSGEHDIVVASEHSYHEGESAYPGRPTYAHVARQTRYFSKFLPSKGLDKFAMQQSSDFREPPGILPSKMDKTSPEYVTHLHKYGTHYSDRYSLHTIASRAPPELHDDMIKFYNEHGKSYLGATVLKRFVNYLPKERRGEVKQ